MATLFLTCGLPGSGKTTLAKRIEHDRPALRLTADEWLFELFGPDPEPPEVMRGAPSARRTAVEALQWEIAAAALRLGVDVVVDWGVWSRRERDDYRARAKALGARTVVCFLDVARDEQWRRVSERNANLPPGAFRIEEQYLDLWASWFDRPTHEELRDDDDVHIEDYSGAYPRMFEREAAAIRALLGEPSITIEHHGSTAVPGLPAKPVIDLMVAVADLDEAERYARVLAGAGYEPVDAIYRDLMPDRIIAIRREYGVRCCHVHLILRDGDEYRRNLAFRDYLRAHPDVAAEYASLKRRSAQQHRDDREAYRKSKSDFIERVTNHALAEIRSAS
jgi:GrpB-like predicted nucleotidyltransferase (UPF0157 family)/predicted kinase